MPRVHTEAQKAAAKHAENKEATKKASPKWRDANPDCTYEYRNGHSKNAKRTKISQATAVVSGNTRVAKITNTTNIIHNGGAKLEPEFEAHIGDVLAEEEFEASQPGQPVYILLSDDIVHEPTSAPWSRAAGERGASGNH